MNRACDYSDATPPPTSDDFNALKMKVMQLEASLHGRHNQPTPYTPSSSSGLATGENIAHQLPAYNPPQDVLWQSVQNRFPAIAFLDGDTFKYGGLVVCKRCENVPLTNTVSLSPNLLSICQRYVLIYLFLDTLRLTEGRMLFNS
jgi:hypothetical protein